MSKTLIAVAALFAVALSVSPIPQQVGSPLKDVGDLIVGEWTGEGIYAADYPGVGKKGEPFTSTHTCQWTAGEAAVACEGSGSGSTWTALYWWDAGAKQVMYVGVNSGGNYDQGTFAKKGAKLVWESSGYFADGQPVTFKGETIFEDDGDTQIAVGATILDGAPSEFRDIYRRVTN
ncbi:hypothetical protein ES703_99877 [subsurface metagenome]